MDPGRGKSEARGTDLEGIFITSGVNNDGKGFCTVAAHSTGGAILLGQLTPDEVRKLALDWLECAEGADQDAAVLRVLRKLELPDHLAGLVIKELRDSRAD